MNKSKYVGVDGCKGGWFSLGLNDSGDHWETGLCTAFSELVTYYSDASLILVDMPIGLPDEGPLSFRDCDEKARGKLGSQRSRVFRAASRRLVDKVRQNKSWKHSDANSWSKREWNGKGIGAQEFGIVKKTAEIDKVMTSHSKPNNVQEAHPEVCFRALSKVLDNETARFRGKHDGLGFLDRFRILRGVIPGTEQLCNDARASYPESKVGADDILDALVAAVTAKLSYQDGYELRTLPATPPKDSKGLPMEMVYVAKRA